jgi:hypothetical protein
MGKLKPSDRLAVALACLAGVMAIVLFFLEKTPAVIVLLLLFMLLLLLYPILRFLGSRCSRCIAIVVAAMFALAFGWHLWPATLTIEEMDFAGVVTGWGARPPAVGLGGEGYLEINTTKLLPYKNNYDVLAIARPENTRVDAMTDPIIQKSAIFSINSLGKGTTITIPLSQQFLKASLALFGSQVRIQLYLCLVPHRFDLNSITTLSDVTARGGHVLRPAYGGGVQIGPPR